MNKKEILSRAPPIATEHCFFEGTQALPACLSDKSDIKIGMGIVL
jgi:hypothetical protein